jgi:8-oxo-dGTP pyrophosphatase MutT (NUDIX family)
MGGAHVFPGGRLDPEDYVAQPERCCDGVSGAIARLASRPPDAAVAFHIAALRELFEEAGVLLARDARVPAGADPTPQAVRSAPEAVVDWRRDLLEHRLTMSALAQREGLRLALDALTPFAHWLTPEIETRRFDTHFFFAVVPGDQEAVHDDREHTHGTWMRPADAIDAGRRGEIGLPPPTWTTLRALSRFARVEDAQAWARTQRAPCILPRVTQRADGARLIMLPGDPGCPPVDGFEAEELRFVLEQGRWRPIESFGV